MCSGGAGATNTEPKPAGADDRADVAESEGFPETAFEEIGFLGLPFLGLDFFIFTSLEKEEMLMSMPIWKEF